MYELNIVSAIYGCNFCTGGKKAFQALSSNILRVAAINSVGDFVLFLGKVLVVALTVVSGVCLLEVKIFLIKKLMLYCVRILVINERKLNLLK